jgi:hypothetical protein
MAERLTDKQDICSKSRLVRCTAFTSIDTFLIDISTERVPIDQPVSMNIRHLLLKALTHVLEIAN